MVRNHRDFFSPGFACFRPKNKSVKEIPRIPKEPKKTTCFFPGGNGRERVMYVHFMNFPMVFFWLGEQEK